MTDEDIKAIRMLEFIVNHNSLLGYKPENRQALAEYIINLIEKQQNEIEVLKDQKEYVINEYGETIEKQSKMIDLMAEQLTSPINGKEWVIKYYEKEVGE